MALLSFTDEEKLLFSQMLPCYVMPTIDPQQLLLFEWLDSLGDYRFRETNMLCAIRRGMLGMVKSLRDKEQTWAGDLLDYLDDDKVEMIRWLHENGCPSSDPIYITEWLRKQDSAKEDRELDRIERENYAAGCDMGESPFAM